MLAIATSTRTSPLLEPTSRETTPTVTPVTAAGRPTASPRPTACSVVRRIRTDGEH